MKKTIAFRIFHPAADTERLNVQRIHVDMDLRWLEKYCKISTVKLQNKAL